MSHWNRHRSTRHPIPRVNLRIRADPNRPQTRNPLWIVNLRHADWLTLATWLLMLPTWLLISCRGSRRDTSARACGLRNWTLRCFPILPELDDIEAARITLADLPTLRRIVVA